MFQENSQPRILKSFSKINFFNSYKLSYLKVEVNHTEPFPLLSHSLFSILKLFQNKNSKINQKVLFSGLKQKKNVTEKMLIVPIFQPDSIQNFYSRNFYCHAVS
jgi:hypothetical protein